MNDNDDIMEPGAPDQPTDTAPPTETALPTDSDQPTDPEGDTFDALGLRPELLSALTTLGYEEPTPIQREAIPVLLEGRDLLGQAATGTGKTAAFALPILDGIEAGAKVTPRALVLVPTRELAVQVSEAMYKYGHDLGARVVPIYGGQPIGRQLQALERGVHVVVATPGRALDHIRRGSLPLDDVEIVVLDEADEMLDMGFAEDIDEILDAVPEERQTVLFSATMPPRIETISRQHLTDPVRIQIAATREEPGEAPLVRQRAYVVARAHKAAALGRILDVEVPTAAIVFCRTRTEVDQLTETLNGRGYRAEPLHGGMSQEQRDRVMGRMRAGTAELLIATDVAARGLDLDQLTHVVNYDVPSAPEAYVHRIGRVGRAGREGVAITLAEPREQRQLANIERLTRRPITMEKIPSVADLRARQLELTIDTVRGALEAGDLERFAEVVDGLADEHELRDIALAAVRLVHEAATGPVDEKEIPEPFVRREREERAPRGDRPGRDGGGAGGPAQHGPTASLYIGLGRSARITPGDIVGAIANETELVGRQIGPIRIAEGFSVVGVPEWAADRVIAAMSRTTLKGRSAVIRRYTDEPRPGRDAPGGEGGRPPRQQWNRDDRAGRDDRPPRQQWNRDDRPQRDDRPGRSAWNRDDRPPRGNPSRDDRGGPRPARDDRPPRSQWNRDDRSGGGRPTRDDRPPRAQWNRDDRPPSGGPRGSGSARDDRGPGSSRGPRPPKSARFQRPR